APVPIGSAARSIAASYFHSCVLRDDNQLLCWGANDCGQLGDGMTCGMCPTPKSAPCGRSMPAPVHLGGLIADSVGLGAFFGCAHIGDSAEHVMCWGRNDFAQAGSLPGSGMGISSAMVPVPQKTGALHIHDISVGAYHSCAIKNATVICWGRN